MNICFFLRKMLWMTIMLGVGTSGFIWGDIYIHNGSQVMGINEEDGSIKWHYKPQGQDGVGFESGAVGQDNTIYVVRASVRSENDELHAISSDGKKKWVKEVKAPFNLKNIGVSPSACYDFPFVKKNSRVFLTCKFIKKIFGTNSYSILYEINGRTGKVISYHEREEVDEYIDDFRYGAPSIDTQGNLYIGFGNYILGLEKKDLRWGIQFEEGPFLAPLIISEQNEMIYAAIDHSIWGITTEGNAVWRFGKTIINNTVPALGEHGAIFVGDTDGWFYSLDGHTGTVRWRQEVRDSIGATPAIAKNRTVYIGSRDGTFYAFSGATGQVKWTLKLPGIIYSPEIGKNGTIYVTTIKIPDDRSNPERDSYLHAIFPQGKIKWRIKLRTGKLAKEIKLLGLSHPTSQFSFYTSLRQ